MCAYVYLAGGCGGDDAPPIVLVGLGDPEAVIMLLPITSEDLVALAACLLLAGGIGRVHVAGADWLCLVAHGDRSICGSAVAGSPAKTRRELDAGT
jgi:hypothetical protein